MEFVGALAWGRGALKRHFYSKKSKGVLISLLTNIQISCLLEYVMFVSECVCVLNGRGGGGESEKIENKRTLLKEAK